MNKVFCYGTLQDPQDQMDLIRRIPVGYVDSIDDYIVLRDYIDPEDGIAYPRLVEMKNGCVWGNIYQFTDDELSIIDHYETDMYSRRYITTAKGEEVQVYLPIKSTYQPMI